MAGQHNEEAWASTRSHPTNLYEHVDDSDTAGARKRVQLYARDNVDGSPVQLSADSDGKLDISSNISATVDNVGLIDTSDTHIDPATEDKQDDIITELQQIEEGTDKIPTDPSTESKQDDANALLATIDMSLNNIEADMEDIDTRLAHIESDTDPLAKYAIVDKDDDAEPNYFGFQDGDGNWYIMKEESNAYRYTAGTSDYSTNWGNRASLSYDYRSATSIA